MSLRIARGNELVDVHKEIKNQLVADIAAVFTVIAFLPMIWHITKNKAVECIPYSWLIISAIANVLWLYSGITDKLSSNVILGGSLLVILAYLSFIKYKYSD